MTAVEEYNAHAAAKERHEHPAVKRARNQVGLVNRLQHEATVAEVAASNAKIQLARDLRAMKDSGAPDEPWAAHWRRALDLD